MTRVMRVSLVTFVISLGVWTLIAVGHQVASYISGGGLLSKGQWLLTAEIIAIDLAILSGLVMLALLVYQAWERLQR